MTHNSPGGLSGPCKLEDSFSGTPDTLLIFRLPSDEFNT